MAVAAAIVCLFDTLIALFQILLLQEPAQYGFARPALNNGMRGLLGSQVCNDCGVYVSANGIS
jgi:hypothetical protein